MRMSSILLFALGTLHFKADAANFRCYDGSFEDFIVFSLSDPTPLLNCSCYDPDRDTVFFTYGFTGTARQLYAEAIVKVYLSLSKNIVLVDWEYEASGGIMGEYLGYITAVSNSYKVGKLVGRALIILTEAGLNLIKIELLGFSLGASLMAYAAREFKTSGQNITRVVGFDPAGPFFDGELSLRGLDAGSARFVLIIHTNPGRLGTVENAGTVDVRVNCGGMGIQPGCENNTDQAALFSPENSCSHARSWKYFVEALKRKDSFIARRATSCASWNDKGDTISLGDDIDLSTSGVFYLNTNSEPNYGKGEAGSIPDSQE